MFTNGRRNFAYRNFGSNRQPIGNLSQRFTESTIDTTLLKPLPASAYKIVVENYLRVCLENDPTLLPNNSVKQLPLYLNCPTKTRRSNTRFWLSDGNSPHFYPTPTPLGSVDNNEGTIDDTWTCITKSILRIFCLKLMVETLDIDKLQYHSIEKHHNINNRASCFELLSSNFSTALNAPKLIQILRKSVYWSI